MLNIAIYARYSDDNQRATSIDDQLRRCHEVAARNGFKVDQSLIFTDAAITGTAKGTAKRPGCQRLLDAIELDGVDVIIVDEISRLTRSAAEGGRLLELAESQGLRFMTADGIDSNQEGWKLNWLFKLVTATHEVDAIAHRTKRGMIGQLERGYQIAQPSYGYRAFKDVTSGGRVLGTYWRIDESEAAVVRRMYELRIGGLSGAMIAAQLNHEGVVPPGQHRKDSAAYWRASTVLRLLANTTYRGVFVWNGSSFTKHKAKRRRKPVDERHFERPALRLVSDEDWHKANPDIALMYTRSYAPRGGGKRLFSGLVRCGDCGALCSPGSGTKSVSLYCPQCEAAVRAGGREGWIGYSSVNAGKAVLRWALSHALFPDQVLEAAHVRLEARLREGPAQELNKVMDELRLAEDRVAKVKRLMLTLHKGTEEFAAEFDAAVAVREQLKSRATRLKAMQANVDEKVVELQRRANLPELLDRLLDETTLPAFKVKATLRRVLSRFVLVSRPKRGVSVYRIGLMPGVLVAELTGTPSIDNAEVAFTVTISTTARRPVVWDIDAVRWDPETTCAVVGEAPVMAVDTVT